jgi:hypothetical protein
MHRPTRSPRTPPLAQALPRLAVVAASSFVIACAASQPGSAPAAAAAALPAGVRGGSWVDLLPGDASAWRGYRQDTLPSGWRFDAAAGTLSRTGRAGDIITDRQWGDFELELEWRVGPGGNSGVFYRATEATDVIYMNAPEMQILDNSTHADGRNPLTSTGSNYALHAPERDVSRPVGEWNRARIVAVGPHVEHWLNGTKLVEYRMGSAEWEALVKASKFNQWPAYGRSMRGHIGLQDHGDPVSFRRIRIRELTR